MGHRHQPSTRRYHLMGMMVTSCMENSGNLEANFTILQRGSWMLIILVRGMDDTIDLETPHWLLTIFLHQFFLPCHAKYAIKLVTYSARTCNKRGNFAFIAGTMTKNSHPVQEEVGDTNWCLLDFGTSNYMALLLDNFYDARPYLGKEFIFFGDGKKLSISYIGI